MSQLFYPGVQMRITGKATGLDCLEIVNHGAHQRILIFSRNNFCRLACARVHAGQGHLIFGHTHCHCITSSNTHGHRDLAGLAAHYAESCAPKGEIVVVVGPPLADAVVSEEYIEARLAELLQSASVRDAAAQLAAETGLARRDLYTRALRITGDKT